MNECIHSSGINNVSILPSGEPTENWVDLLNSIKFKSLIAYLRDNYDFVIIDVPPVLPVPDALTISKSCDAIIFVIKAGGNDVRLSQKALKKLVASTTGGGVSSNTLDRRKSEEQEALTAPHKILGVVLNMTEHKSGKPYEYYKNKVYGYYGKHYGPEYADTTKKS